MIQKQFFLIATNETKEKGYLIPDGFVGGLGYVFTAENLNEYTANVIRQALETAAEKANMIGETQHNNNAPDRIKDFVYVVDSNGPDYGYTVNKESITNTFEETFKKFKHD